MKKLKVFDNIDKKNHESWTPNRHIMNFPGPFRMLITGLPGSGKTLTIHNILSKIEPTFNNVFLIHPETFSTINITKQNELKNEDIISEKTVAEYKDIDFIGLKYFPTQTFFDEIKDKKNLLIIDDIDLKQYVQQGKWRAERINKLLSFTSTHRNLSIIVSAQDIYSQLIPCIYRFSNIFVLYKFNDRNQITYLSRNIGIDSKALRELFKLCKVHDSITIDKTIGSPAMYRFNILNPIEVCND